MSSDCETAALTKGLRALEILASAAPVDPGGFARAIGVGVIEAANLLEAFETFGYARRVPGGAFFVLTRLALGLVDAPSLAGQLVSHSIEPIVEFGDRIGHVVALSIPAGRTLICCAVSRCCSAAGVSPGLRRSWPDRSKTLGGSELSVVLGLDGEPIALLSIHCVQPPMLDYEIALQWQLEALAARLVRNLPRGPERASRLANCNSASAIAASAMVH